MKVFLDQYVFFDVTAIVRAAGIDVVHARECGMSRTEDDIILAHCAANGMVSVTHDEDFHALLTMSAAMQPSVIRLRVMLGVEATAAINVETLRAGAPALSEGAAVSVGRRGTRIHHLPIG